MRAWMQPLRYLAAIALLAGCLDTVDENLWRAQDGLPDLGDGSVATSDGPRPEQLLDGPRPDRLLPDGPLPPDTLAPDAPDPGACSNWSNYNCTQASVCTSTCPTSGTALYSIVCTKNHCICTNTITLANNTCATQATITCATCQNALTIGCCNGV
jgi:hypothetical protein